MRHRVTHLGRAVALAALVAAAPAAAAAARWAGAWGYPTAPASGKPDEVLPAGTYRYRIIPSQSGDAVRLTFTNPEGAPVLLIARVAIGAAADDGVATAPSREQAARFGAAASATLAPGASIVSAPVAWPVRSGEAMIVTIVTTAPSAAVGGNAALPVGFAEGPELGFEAKKLRPFLTMVAVRNPPTTCTIVTLGDSITEGARGTRGDRRGWPHELARRLAAAAPRRHCGVVNAGISGNRLLRNGRGTAAVDRFDRDVASVPGVSDVILLEGINDIWRSTLPGEPPLTAADLVAGYTRLIAAAHARGLRIHLGTLTPGAGSKYLTPPLEAIRQDVNRWIRDGHGADGVIDFERAVRDDAQPPRMRADHDSGDHLHPGDAGYTAMGAAVPLTLFRAR